MKILFLAFVIALAGCAASGIPSHKAAAESSDASQGAEVSSQRTLVAAFHDQGAIKQKYPDAELAGRYGEVTLWRLAMTPQRWKELETQGRYSPVFGELKGRLRALPGGVVVRLKPGFSGQKAADWFRKEGLTAQPLAPLPNAYLVETPAGTAALEVANKLAKRSPVASAEPNWWQAYSYRK